MKNDDLIVTNAPYEVFWITPNYKITFLYLFRPSLFEREEILLDPFCGSDTFLVAAYSDH
jgi:hypothetical protein